MFFINTNFYHDCSYFHRNELQKGSFHYLLALVFLSRQKQAALISDKVLNKINIRKSQQQQQERDPKLLRLGSINVRVKKTAQALNEMMGGGGGGGSARSASDKRPHSVVVLTGSTRSLTGTSSLSSPSTMSVRSEGAAAGRRFSSVDPSDSNGVNGHLMNPSLSAASSTSSSLSGRNQSRRGSNRAKNGFCDSNSIDESESDMACGFGEDWRH